MPSKQTSNDVIAIEELVNEIKQNLRFAPSTADRAPPSHPLLQPTNHNSNSGSNELFLPQSKHFSHHAAQQQLIIRKQRSRPSPYHIPCRSWGDSSAAAQKQKHLQKTCNNENALEDPYELLQSLLKNNSLVKEAVRRLNLSGPSPSPYSRKQNYFYDSDEDNRSPMTMVMCQLES
jgi:hypothetical protein